MMTRTIDFRFRVIRNGGDLCELLPANDSTPMLTMNENNSIRTGFSGEFRPPVEDVNWLTDEIRPEMILNGITYRLGVFIPNKVDEVDNGISKSLRITAYDRGWLVRDHRAETRPFFAAGTNYLEAVVSALTASGIGSISEVPTDQVLAEDREDWDVGVSWLEVVNKLLSEINYNSVWFNADGTCMLEPIATPTAANIDHMLDEHDVQSMITPGYQKVTDFYETPNVFICVCSNPDKAEAMVATAENTNPQSPLSIPRRGRRIAQLLYVDNIASEEELQVYANRQVTESMLTGETFQIQTALLPGFGVGDVTGLKYGDILTVCREKAWSMQLGVGGKMTHTLERVILNLE